MSWLKRERSGIKSKKVERPDLPEGLYQLRPLDDLLCGAGDGEGWIVRLQVLAAL